MPKAIIRLVLYIVVKMLLLYFLVFIFTILCFVCRSQAHLYGLLY